MDIVTTSHRILGEMILPLLIVIAAIWFTVSWKPNAPTSTAARLFPILVDLQATLGIIYFVLLVVAGDPDILTFPLLLHPVIGLLAAGFAHMAVKGGPFRSLGRWAALAGLAVLLVMVLGNVLLVRAVA